MSLLRTIDIFMHRLCRIPASGWLFIAVPVIISCVRIGAEHLMFPWLGQIESSAIGLPFLLAHLLDVTIFYVLLQLVLLMVLAVSSGRPWREVAGPASVGMVICWLPPLIDLFLPPQPERGYAYFVSFSWDFTAPYQLMGETVTLWLAVLLSGAFVLWQTRAAWRTALALGLSYLAMQFMLWGWMAAARGLSRSLGTPLHTVGLGSFGFAAGELAGLILIATLHGVFRFQSLWPSLRRINHALPWGMVAAAAARLAGLAWPETILRGLVCILAFELVVVANDFFDQHQDGAAGGTVRPVGRDEMLLAHFLQILLMAWVVIIHPAGAYAVLLFFVLFLAYHHPDLRVKRLFGGAYLIEGLAAAACVVYGSQGGDAGPALPWMALLAIAGFALGCMFKDYKDIPQDRADGVETIYTRLIHGKMRAEHVHRGVVAVSTIQLLVPPTWLLLRGAPIWHAAVLASLAAVTGALLLWVSDRTRAVESTMWGLGLYLLVFVVLVPGPAVPDGLRPTQTVAAPGARGVMKAAAGPRRYDVVFDQSQEQVYSPFDVGYSGMSRLTRALRYDGARVRLSSQSLETFLPTFHGLDRVLVLGVAMERTWRPAELAAIHAFLRAGGGVLVVVEHDDLFHNATFQNQLTTAYGISTLPELALAQATQPAPGWPTCGADRFGLEEIVLYGPAPLALETPAEELAVVSHPERPEHRVVAAANLHIGAGRMVVLGDAEVLWNMTPVSGIRQGDNPNFVIGVFRLLAGYDTDAPIRPPPRAAAPPQPPRVRTVLFESTGDSLIPGRGDMGLDAFAERLDEAGFRVATGGGPGTRYEDYELVVVAVPLTTPTDLVGLRRAHRLLLVSDGQSDYLDGLEGIRDRFPDRAHHRAEDFVNPLNLLLESTGMRFLPTTIINAGSNCFFSRARWVGDGGDLPFTLQRATAIEPLGGAFPPDVEIWAETLPPARPLDNLLLLHAGRARYRVFNRSPEGDTASAPLPVVVATPTVLAVSDLELLLPQFINSPEGDVFVHHILTWVGK